MRIFNGYTFRHFLILIIHGRVPSSIVIGAKLKLLDRLKKLKQVAPDDEIAYKEILNNIAQKERDEYIEYRNNPKWFHIRYKKSDQDESLSPAGKKIIQKHTIAEIKGRLDQLEELID